MKKINKMLQEIRDLVEFSGDAPIHLLKRGKVKEWNEWYDGRELDLQGTKVDLQDINLRGVNLRGVDLRRANLMGANLRGANLMGANLRGANLGLTELQGADFSKANLRSADFYRANLERADLSKGLNIKTANFARIKYDLKTKWPKGFDVTKYTL